MSDTPPHGSEVARIMRRIREEYAAAQQGLSGLASGTSKHVFITKKMEHMGRLQEELQGIMGEMPAIALIAEQLDLTVEGSSVAQDPGSAQGATPTDEPSATPPIPQEITERQEP